VETPKAFYTVAQGRPEVAEGRTLGKQAINKMVTPKALLCLTLSA
jgi:hypothetical protein